MDSLPIRTIRLDSDANRLVIDLYRLFGEEIFQLPWSMRILLENGVRNSENWREISNAFRHWLAAGASNFELPFYPGRLMLHDTTCVPALVDIAAMRDELAEAGSDPLSLAPAIPVDVSIDHSIAVDRFGTSDALSYNMNREFERNRERYRLIKWATRALPGVRVHPPGTGIMHTINMEQLAAVIVQMESHGRPWLVPDTLIGTDSHTPMINGLGVLGWGVGGLEAESALFGLPILMRLPEVVGVKLIGQLRSTALATDLALTVTERLRTRGVLGCFVEYYGRGVITLKGGDRAALANMAPEYGAATGYFPVDAQTIQYLTDTGRSESTVHRVEMGARAIQLWFDPTCEPRYSDIIEINLDAIGTSLAGPRRPQDRILPSEVLRALEHAEARPLNRSRGSDGIPDGAVAIAAITSCTNTTDPALLVAAGLMARKARMRGLRPPRWVKTSFAPGSPAAQRYLTRAGLLQDLEATGFSIVGFGCTTCIGNSGPLQPEMHAALTNGTVAAAVLSGNRNFPRRVHLSLRNAFLCSPPLVVAYALAGDVVRNIETDAIGTDEVGKPVYLSELWPSKSEVEEVLRRHLDRDDFREAFNAAAMRNAEWRTLDAPESPRFPWDEFSTYVRRPPFATAKQSSRLGYYRARPILVLGDDVTTDQISPAGQIPKTSFAGRFLISRGDAATDLNVYAARRGNWEVMVRGLFAYRDFRNLLAVDAPPGTAMHMPSGEIGLLWEVASRYQAEGVPTVIVAGERYGAGSSRDWAAKGLNLLGVRAILARSFERIHRTNLVGMGILPIILDSSAPHPRIGANDIIEVEASNIRPHVPVGVRLIQPNGETVGIQCSAGVETELEVESLNAGGMIPLILSKFIPPNNGRKSSCDFQ